MTIGTISLVDDPADVAEEWAALWRAVPDACPFRAPSWLLPWWRIFGNGRARIAVLRDHRLLGLLPLYELDGRLLPLGAGITDRQDALLHQAAPPDAASQLLAAALAPSNACDLIDLPPESALRRVAMPEGWHSTEQITEPCPVLDLTTPLPAGALRHWRRASHRAERLGGWQVHLANADNLAACHAGLVALHAARWQAREQSGVLADPAVLAFHRAALPGLLADGVLRLAILTIAGRLAAAMLALLAGRRRILFYLQGHDAEFSPASPAGLLLGQLLQQAAAEGFTEADFLRGGEDYKYHWGAVDRWNVTRRLVRS